VAPPLIYVNEIFINFNIHPVLYADVTCLNIGAQKEEKLQTLLNRDVNKAYHWMTANKLTINTDKSNALIISPERKIFHKYQIYFAKAGTLKYR